MHKTASNSLQVLDQVKVEYDTLRKEIEAAKVWEVRLLIGGLIGFPVAFEWIQKTNNSDLSFVAWFLPLAIVILSFVVGLIRLSAMRCGRYIREILEPHFPLGGWETWREKTSTRHLPEALLAAAFLILVVVYYAVSVAISVIHIRSDLAKDNANALGITFYIVLGALYLIGLMLIILAAWTPTSTNFDRIPLSRLAEFGGSSGENFAGSGREKR